MLEINNKLERCDICSHEYTSTHIEATPEIKIYVCENCLDAATYYFIWLCMHCGKVYMRPKALVIKNIDDYELKRAYLLCEDMQLIQGIDMCIECDSEGIIKFMNGKKMKAEC